MIAKFSNNAASIQTEGYFNFSCTAFFCESNRTAEMTWGETATAQLQITEKPLKQSPCFALTSIELFDAVLFLPRNFAYFFRNSRIISAKPLSNNCIKTPCKIAATLTAIHANEIPFSPQSSYFPAKALPA